MDNCGHDINDHDTDSSILVGPCFLCDCDGFKSTEPEDEFPT
jgi:hypothetical protein